MPSTLVHVAFAGLISAALLGDAFDARALAVVFAVVAVPDLDAFIGLYVVGAHRAALHTLLIPAGLGLLLVYDTRVRARSALRSRWGARGVRVTWVSLLAFVLAAIGPDLVTGGANVLYPVHDQFYRLDGQLYLSDKHGLVQTFLDQPAEGSTAQMHISSGVDAVAGPDPSSVEHVFSIARSGTRLLVVVTSAVVVGSKLWLTRKA